MTSQDAFDAACFAFATYGAFFAAVAQEIGLERARALQTQALAALGGAQGQMIKQQAGVEQVDAQTAYSMLEGAMTALGIGVEMLEASPEKVVFKPGRCPVYEAARTLAVDHEASEANCRSSAIPMMDAMVKQLNPRLSYRLRTFRSGDGASCVEEIAAE